MRMRSMHSSLVAGGTCQASGSGSGSTELAAGFDLTLALRGRGLVRLREDLALGLGLALTYAAMIGCSHDVDSIQHGRCLGHSGGVRRGVRRTSKESANTLIVSRVCPKSYCHFPPPPPRTRPRVDKLMPTCRLLQW